ncbi:hypothetical protein Aab01nite_00090 [Paractinoplanes abujensis]|uniref:Fibronectin type-III domain-containing protein n=1 Tax=Paractinoplanes abujensis TaxID=882441 RepID=A0A7W7CSI7_9ACTN|nr:hypothetical protein [Actinoplanes abujensis]MBB4692166.1 hypothetical protein [Actinoplanes abujensis]GID16419.1 hypothetical protein Aab01nite_00090 [Actinoplanes abujensis]
MAFGKVRVRGAIIATTAAALLGSGMIYFAAQSSAETTTGAAPVRALFTPAPTVGKAVTFTVTGQVGGTALVEWSEVEATPGATFTGYTVWFQGHYLPAKPIPGQTPVPSPTPTPGPPKPDALQSLPITARSATFTGLDPDREYSVFVVAQGPQGQTPAAPAALHVPNTGWNSAPVTVVYGSAVTLSGTTPRAGETVAIERRASGTAAWTKVGSVRSDANLRWGLATKPAETTAYRVTYAGSQNYWGATMTKTVTVRYLVSVKVSTTKPKPNQKVTISGAVRPIKAGVKVSLQRKSGATWVTIAGSTVKPDGSYAIGKTFAKGTWPLRVIATGGTTLAYGTSGQVTLSVR